MHEASKDTEVDPECQSAPSSRSSYCREDSSSGSSVEVIQRVPDASTRKLSSDNEKDAGLGRLSAGHRLLETKVAEDLKVDHSETASTGSWISVDDEFRVKKSKKEKFINGKSSDNDLTKSPGNTTKYRIFWYNDCDKEWATSVGESKCCPAWDRTRPID